MDVCSKPCQKYLKWQVCNIFSISQGKREEWNWFLPVDKHQRFLQIDAIILGVCVTRHAQVTHNNKFTISLQYLKKEVSDEVDFFIQISIKLSYKLMPWFLMRMDKPSQNYPNGKFVINIFTILQNKSQRLSWLLRVNNHQSSLQADFNTLIIKVSSWWYNQFWWAWSSILKLLKVTSFQYLYNISKKKLGMEFIFYMQINIKVSTRWHYCFWRKWPDMLKVPKKRKW